MWSLSRSVLANKGVGLRALWDFAANKYYTDSSSQTYNDLIAARFSRSGSASFIDDDGVLKTVATGVPRRTLAGAIFVEEGTVNLLPSPNLAGASVGVIANNAGPGGSAGARPTGWASRGTLVTGATMYVSAVGVEDGRDYVDIELVTSSGSPSGGFGQYLSGATQVAVIQNDVTTSSFEYKIVSKSANFTAVNVNSIERNSGGTSLGSSSIVPLDVTVDGVRRWFTQTYLAQQATVAGLQFGFEFVHSAGAGSLKVRFYIPQVEKKSKRTSWVNGTRAAESLSIPTYPTNKDVRILSQNGSETVQSNVNLSSGGALPTNLTDARILSVRVQRARIP